MKPLTRERLAELADIQASARYDMKRFDALPKRCRQTIANDDNPCRQELRCLNRDCPHKESPCYAHPR